MSLLKIEKGAQSGVHKVTVYDMFLDVAVGVRKHTPAMGGTRSKLPIQ